MGATEEQMSMLAAAHVSHVSYILILYSVAFLMFLFVCMLLHLYATHAWPTAHAKTTINGANGHVGSSNWPVSANGSRRRPRDSEEFELEGLMSDDDDEGPKSGKTREVNGDVNANANANGRAT